MHPDREPPGFLSMRCKAKSQSQCGWWSATVFFFFRYHNATIKVRVVAIFQIQTKEYIEISKKNKRKIWTTMVPVSGRLRHSGNHGSRFMQSPNLVFQTNAGSLDFISVYGVSRTSTPCSVWTTILGHTRSWICWAQMYSQQGKRGREEKRQLGPLRLTMW